MAAALSQVVGYEQPTQPVSWNKRDLLLYAAGIGAKADDLSLVYELGVCSPSWFTLKWDTQLCGANTDKSFAAMPTYPVVLPFKGDSQELNLFSTRMGKTPPGVPKAKVGVHGSQSIEILKDLPLASGGRVDLDYQVHRCCREHLLLDPKKVPYAKLYSSSFLIGAKTGENFSKVVAGPPQGKPIPKDRKADWTVQDKTTLEQALIFRLSGDYNPLHIDPEVGQKGGFGGVILHGLSTFGFGARALIKAVGGGDPRSLRLFGVRFTAPVKPGDALETEAWEVGPGPNGTVEIAFVTKNLTSGKVALGGGVAYVKKAGPQAKL
ncbi:peroxisomal dehydratase [Mycena olivaceomarginata]|nr:peroxisomal dehydratase [Mycena olivaceomarginata]